VLIVNGLSRKVRDCNEAALIVSGFSREELLGRRVLGRDHRHTLRPLGGGRARSRTRRPTQRRSLGLLDSRQEGAALRINVRSYAEANDEKTWTNASAKIERLKAESNAAAGLFDTVVQQNANASEELASMSEELSIQSEQLAAAMEFFKVESLTATKVRPESKKGMAEAIRAERKRIKPAAKSRAILPVSYTKTVDSEFEEF
jgi:hypothetical protein